MKKFITILIFLLLCIPLVQGVKQGSITVLTVAEMPDGQRFGESATLYLEIRQGSGRVFLDTFPLSKVGTQISMRFAQQIACKQVKANCNKYDFIYTIKANSGIVDGPSAGAAGAILTMALLENKNLNNHVAITGTINSGGYIGPVGGIKEKIDAAKKENITTVLIPRGDRFYDKGVTNETNTTPILDPEIVPIAQIPERILDLKEYGEENHIDIIEIAELEKAWYYFTGEEAKETKEVEIDPQYTKAMNLLSQKLCQRTKTLSQDIAHEKVKSARAIPAQQEKEIINLTTASEKAYAKDHIYTSASLCFRANIAAATALYQLQEANEESIQEKIKTIKESIEEIEEKIDQKPLQTINDLQTFMIVKERLREAKFYSTLSEDQKNDTRLLGTSLAFAGERLYAAVSWSEFFNGKSSKLNLDQKHIESSCKQKIAEVQERYSYLNEYIQTPVFIEQVDRAFKHYQSKDYALCLFEAVKTKAEINVLLTILSTQDHQREQVIEEKINIAKKAILEQQKQGIFPILGYSYYEYAKSLIEQDPGSALLYAEYALELSNLDIYFPNKSFSISINSDKLWVFLLGIGVGILVACYLLKSKKDEEHKKDTKDSKKYGENKSESHENEKGEEKEDKEKSND